jgi:hypothetical protein
VKQKINRARESAYGHPFDDFSRTAGMASALGFRFVDPVHGLRPLGPQDIPILQILVKLSRQSNRHKDDNLDDIHGYTNTLEQVMDRIHQKEKQNK